MRKSAPVVEKGKMGGRWWDVMAVIAGSTGSVQASQQNHLKKSGSVLFVTSNITSYYSLNLIIIASCWYSFHFIHVYAHYPESAGVTFQQCSVL